MTKDDARLAHALISLYSALYKQVYGKVPVINKYREKWAMNDVIESVGYDRAKELVEYYFKTTRAGHPLAWFFYNFEKLDITLTQITEDKNRRELVRQRTKAMVEGVDSEH